MAAAITLASYPDWHESRQHTEEHSCTQAGCHEDVATRPQASHARRSVCSFLNIEEALVLLGLMLTHLLKFEQDCQHNACAYETVRRRPTRCWALHVHLLCADVTIRIYVIATADCERASLASEGIELPWARQRGCQETSGRRNRCQHPPHMATNYARLARWGSSLWR